MQFNVGFRTDLGRKRSENQDNGIAVPENGLFIVADGMGGHLAGEVASKTVVNSIEDYFKSQDNNLEKNALDSLKNSIVIANQNVIQASTDKEELRGMGSTCTAMLIFNNKTFLAHVGD